MSMNRKSCVDILKTGYEVDLGVRPSFAVLQENEAPKEKLIYITKSYIGDAKSEENTKHFAELLAALLECGTRTMVFLLIEDAVETMVQGPCLEVWKKAFVFDHKIYVIDKAKAEISSDFEEKIHWVNMFEAADLLLNYEVLTLN